MQSNKNRFKTDLKTNLKTKPRSSCTKNCQQQSTTANQQLSVINNCAKIDNKYVYYGHLSINISFM